MTNKRRSFLSMYVAGLSALLAVGAAAAEIDVPLRHWQAPLMFAGAPAQASIPSVHHLETAAATTGIQPLALPSAQAELVAITPCRIINTIPGQSAAFTPGTPIGTGVTTFNLTAAPAPCNGIPSNAVAFSLNVAVVARTAPGYLSAFPGATAPSPLTSLVNYAAGQQVANASVIPGDSSGIVGFLAQNSVDIVVDINGYYVPATGSGVPTGTILAWTGAPPLPIPTGFLLCDGRAVNRTTYKPLLDVIGIEYGGGDGINDFNLPDLKGRFLRGVDQGSGRDPDASTRKDQSGAIVGDKVGSVEEDYLQDHTHGGYFGTNGFWTVYGSGNPLVLGYSNPGNTGAMSSGRASQETRPKNSSVYFIIKY